MTSAARRNVAAARLRARRVTAIANRMSVEVNRYGHRRTAAHFAVTRRTGDVTHLHVQGMIELHAEADQSIRKRFERA